MPQETPSILSRIARGESDAVGQCLDSYGALVWSLVRRQGIATNEAEDLVQEIFVDLWKSAGRFDPSKSSEASFICMIARRRMIDRRRKLQRQPPTDSLTTIVQEPTGSTHLGLEARAEVALANRALGKLKPQEREALLLSIKYGMSHSQIADHTGMPLGTVKTYIRRSLLRVQEVLTVQEPVGGALGGMET